MVIPDAPPLPRLAPRKLESHKGDYGHCLLVGGSRGMAGAIALAGKAALRGGAGRVTVAIPDNCLDVVAALEPCYLTLALPTDGESRIVAEARDRLQSHPADCLACGPGLGTGPHIDSLIRWMYQTLTQPMVIDADGLTAMARQHFPWGSSAGPRILTPHPGEFRRLIDRPDASVAQLRESVSLWAQQQQVTVVLKGHRSIITDGDEWSENGTGNPGMATGGTGDVLTGLLVALLGQGLAPLPAARLAVHLHGLAGDLAAAQIGQVSLIARDLIDYLPAAIRHHHSDLPQ
jgi:ADP-dependent NAD(P)H-hydrate dehydratase